MSEKPSYRELEERVHELEQAESECTEAVEALRESETRFRLLYERAPLGYQSLDGDGCLLEVNQAWLDALGYTREEVIGKSFGDFVSADWSGHFEETFPRFKSIGEVLGVEFEMVRKDGSTILASFNGRIGLDKNGGFKQTHCLLHDITEKKRSEEALRESEERLKTILDSMMSGVVMIDANTHEIVDANPAAIEMIGAPKKQVIGSECHQYICPAEKGACPISDLGQKKDNSERILIQADGEEIPIIKTVTSISVKGREYLLEDFIDITEKKRLESQLRESERRYRTVADFTYDWEYWIAPDGSLVYISPSCERITGYSVNDFVENPRMLREVIHPDDRDSYIQHLDDIHIQGVTCQIDFRIIRRDGEECWIDHRCQPIVDPKGNNLGRRCTNRDVTYQKKIELDLVNQKKALLEKTISLEKANELLKTLLDQRDIERRSIEQSMVTNLKRFVFPYLDDLEREKSSGNAETYLNTIRTNIEQLIAPVSDNLSGAYLDLTPTEVKIADLIRQGHSTKSMAVTLNISKSTVEKHRNKIRKKLNLLNKKVNLHTFLNSLA